MRLVPIKVLFISMLALVFVVPATTQAWAGFGLGGVLGLVTAPLRLLGHGIAGWPRAYRHHHQERASSPALAAHPSRNAEDEPITEARVEPLPAAAPPRATPSSPLWPTASPSVYEDLIGYILLPNDYADRLWSHGYGDIMNAALTPAAESPLGPDQAANLINDGMCSDQAKELAGKPMARLDESLALTSTQRVALEDLRAALDQAIDRGRMAICRAAPATPADRLRRMVKGLWTMWDAALLLRAPLKKFYDLLDDAQKAKLSGTSRDQGVARACAEQRSTDWPPDRIERMIKTSKVRALDGETLRQQLADMAKFLATSCPQGTEPTPMSRLQAASDRMKSLRYVVVNMSPVFGALYSSLDGTQKTQFDPRR